MWASAPTGCVRVRIGVCGFVTSYRAGGVEPRPYGVDDGFYGFAGVRADLRRRTAGRGKPLPYVTTKSVKWADVVIGPYAKMQKTIPG